MRPPQYATCAESPLVLQADVVDKEQFFRQMAREGNSILFLGAALSRTTKILFRHFNIYQEIGYHLN